MFRLVQRFALVVSFCALARPVAAGPIQIGILVDSSGSIGAGNFGLMTTGLKNALLSQIPTNSSVELTVVQFSSGTAVVVSPTLINNAATLTLAANAVGAMPFLGATTNMNAGITAIAGQMTGSALFPSVDRSFINIVSDGLPNAGGGEAGAITARNNALTDGIDDIDAEFVTTGGAAGQNFLQNSIVFPQPGIIAPPFNNANGFVIPVPSFGAEFEQAFASKLSTIIQESQIPEPASLALLGLAGAYGVGAYLRRRRAAA